MTSDLLNVVVTDAGTLKFPPKLFGKLHSTWESGQCGPGRARWAGGWCGVPASVRAGPPPYIKLRALVTQT